MTSYGNLYDSFKNLSPVTVDKRETRKLGAMLNLVIAPRKLFYVMSHEVLVLFSHHLLSFLLPFHVFFFLSSFGQSLITTRCAVP